MTSLHWTLTLLILLGAMVDAQAQTCTNEYLQSVNQCLGLFIQAVSNSSYVAASSEYNTTITSQLLLVKIFCERSDYKQALICVLNGMKVCANAFSIPQELISKLKNYDESLINKMCGYLPALEQNLSCLNGLVSSTKLLACFMPAFAIPQDINGTSCRKLFAYAMCGLSEVQNTCPAIGQLYIDSLQLYADQSCSIEKCIADYGVCGGNFQRNMPPEAVQSRVGDLPALGHGIQYICGSGMSNVQCMMKGGLCGSFNDLMTIPLMFGIQLEPASYLVNHGCKDINILTSKLTCIDQQFASQEFQACFNKMLTTMSSVPSTTYDIVSCGIYQGTSNCMNSIVAKQCGQDAVDYYIKWSPALFRLAEGCGSWKVSSASSMEKITGLILIQLSFVLLFLLQN
ncbi:hypothetical protein CHS0354_004548 [Potamilus streckersoni]|uniref:T20D4.11-like domain-containing protein n=1 Tax=Potamilus streckersoni TaxID=2493646 RepID=A0AAE0VQT9_9BIVA|nr:hypothetical protein CHS0354_004548 [Potamilus streckersoni]